MTSDSVFPALTLPCGIPLLPVSLPDTDDFITDVSFASPKDRPDILLVKALFDLSRFDERLFRVCDLPAPIHLSHAVRKRRAEYLASRVIVRYALERMGVEAVILANDADRVPVWPEGISGSLTHTHQNLAVLLSPGGSKRLLGVDCEKVMRREIAEEMQNVIVTAEEKRKLLECGLPVATAMTLAFSAKESLYKALFPTLRQYMDFSAAEITGLIPATGKVSLRLTASLADGFPAGREFIAQVELHSLQVISWIIEN